MIRSVALRRVVGGVPGGQSRQPLLRSNNLTRSTTRNNFRSDRQQPHSAGSLCYFSSHPNNNNDGEGEQPPVSQPPSMMSTAFPSSPTLALKDSEQPNGDAISPMSILHDDFDDESPTREDILESATEGSSSSSEFDTDNLDYTEDYDGERGELGGIAAELSSLSSKEMLEEDSRFFNTADENVLRQRTAALANENVPFGEFTTFMWREAIHLLKRWTISNRLAHTPESVDQAFLLLDRLVMEQEVQKFHKLSWDVLNTMVLRDMIYNWHKCVNNFHKYSLDDQALLRYEFTPMELLARLEDYSDRSPRLQFDTKCMNMIIAGAGRCSLPGSAGEAGMISPSVATSFSEHLFDRMAMNSNPQKTSGDDALEQQGAHIDHGGDDGGAGGEVPPLGQYQNSRHRHGLPSTRPDLKTYSSMIKIFALNGLASRAEALLNTLYNEYQETSNPYLKPDVAIFTAVMMAWSHSKEPNSATRADAILKRMQELSDCGIESVAPDMVAYGTVLKCWARVAGREGQSNEVQQMCADRAREILSEMEALGNVTTFGYNVMMEVYGKTGNLDLAEELLLRMQQEYVMGNENVKPTRSTYNILLTAWARSGSPKSGDRAEQILEAYEQHYHNGDVSDPPCRITYNSVLTCLAEAGAAERAEKVLERMKQVQSYHGEDIRPNSVSYNIVINAYAEAKNPRRAESLLEDMYQEYSAMKGKNTHIEPDVITFGTVLKAWLRSGDAHAAVRADAIFKTMQGLQDAKILDVGPQRIAYNILIACWCDSQHPDAPFKALGVLTEMENKFNGGNSLVRPDARTYDDVIKFFANRRLIHDAGDTLEKMHIQSLPTARGGMGNTRAKPGPKNYNRVLGACSRSRDSSSAEQAESLWKRWQDRFETGMIDEPPDTLAMQLVLDAWTNTARHGSDAGSRAKAFLEEVQRKYDAGDTNVAPRLKAHIAVLEVFVKLKDPASAHDYFIRMCDKCLNDDTSLKPSIAMLNYVLATWRSSGSRHAAQNAEQLLQRARELSKSGAIDWNPTPRSYRVYLNCLEEQPSMQAGAKAEIALQEMEELSASDGSKQMKLEERDYIQIVRIWSRVKNPEALFHADAAFQKTMDVGHVPSTKAFRFIIDAWSRSSDSASVDRANELREQRSKAHGGRQKSPVAP